MSLYRYYSLNMHLLKKSVSSILKIVLYESLWHQIGYQIGPKCHATYSAVSCVQ